MKKLLLALVLSLYAALAPAAITVVGQAFSSTDNTDGTNDTVAITAPGSLAFGDLMVVYLNMRNASLSSFSLDDDGGQNWKRYARVSGSPASDSHIFTWCIYNGSSDGTFQWTLDTSDGNVGGWMIVFRGVQKDYPWDVLITEQAQASSTTWAMGSLTTLTSGAVAFFAGSSQDDNTWTIDNSFAAPVSAIYWRNLFGADSSVFFAIKTISSPGAVGSTTATQATLGADGGSDLWGAIRQAGSGRRGITM